MPLAPEYAYPFEHHQKFSLDNPTISSPGLSKREYVASMVLQGIVSNPQTNIGDLPPEQRQVLAYTAVLLADDLLAALGAQ
ncbi:hypothetical protein [Thermostichus vulcanus]|uniref:Uncharacterized protein n=1 Tax=Thermostichus vulcanus str. 'Rupite' TaxID=2813851 RepID=A0ABT0CFJ3_THEVL|nr:hypothetical protein [Thermostichus vulcanus]MCJ2544549.1 hypothetical protein [Thermostichus vulcanus str. 'Rupite']